MLGIATAVAITEIVFQILFLLIPITSDSEGLLRIFRGLYLIQMPLAVLVLAGMSLHRIMDSKHQNKSQFSNLPDAFRFSMGPLLCLLIIYSLGFLALSFAAGTEEAGLAVIIIAIFFGVPTVLLNGLIYASVAISREAVHLTSMENGTSQID